MAVEVRHFEITVPHGTLSTAPQTTAMLFPARTVEAIEVMVPPGPSGFMGFRIASAGTQIVPWNAGSWQIADDRVFHWPLTDQINSGSWQCIAYNTGTYDHKLYIDFWLSVVQPLRAAAFPPPIDNDALSGETGLLN